MLSSFFLFFLDSVYMSKYTLQHTTYYLLHPFIQMRVWTFPTCFYGMNFRKYVFNSGNVKTLLFSP